MDNITVRFAFVSDPNQFLHTAGFETWSDFEDWKGKMGGSIKIISEKLRCIGCD